MTLVLFANIILAALVLCAVIGVGMWAIKGSRHEGRPVGPAQGRRWARHTISLRHEPARNRRPVRPFAT